MWGVLAQLIVGWLFIATLMVTLWFVQRRTGNAGIVDAGWSGGIGALGIFFAATAPGDPVRRFLVALLIGIWSVRLAFYLLRDRVIGQPEEGRYRTLRQKWGPETQGKMFRFFQMQAAAAVFFAVPVLVVAWNPVPTWTGGDVIGVVLWGFSVGNTILADRQLARFKRRPESRERTCREGWWRYSRHPNYFFEWLHWWSYVALATGSPFWWVALLAPAAMLYILLWVTGIPPTEAQAVARRGEDYRRYQRTTSAFVPWFPKKGGESE